MSARDWDKELARIDKELAKISDDELLDWGKPPALPASPQGQSGQAAGHAPAQMQARAEGGAVVAAQPPSRWGVIARVSLAAALAIGVQFWPYGSRCGLGLAVYLASVGVVTLAGAWAATSTWRARAGRAHIASLVVIASGIAMATVEILPRIGYAADPARSSWVCS